MLKKISFLLILITVFCAKNILAQTTETILKQTLIVTTVKDVRYWKEPTKDNFWSWMPSVRFTAMGAIPSGSFFTVEFFTQGEKPWFSVNTNNFEIKENGWENFQTSAVESWQDKRSTIETGIFGFKITLNNSLSNSSKEVYKGKFKVSKFFAGTEHANFKNQYVFYVEHDWAMPIGYAAVDWISKPKIPPLKVSMWLKGEFSGKVIAKLYYKGKEISNTENKGSAAYNDYSFVPNDDKKIARWERWDFTFSNVLGWNNDGYADPHLLAGNGGEYQIKVAIDGELARTATIKITDEGKIDDGGIARNNGMGDYVFIVPVKIIPDKEPKIDMNMWKNAFYGNPLKGFDYNY